MSERVAAKSSGGSCSSPSARGRDWRYPVTIVFAKKLRHECASRGQILRRSCSSPSARGRDWRYPATNRFRDECVTL